MKTNNSDLTPANAQKLKPIPFEGADLVEAFSITTDSVVATVKVKVKNSTRRFRIDWGDGAFNDINYLVLFSGALPDGSIFVLPDGTLQLQHAYEAPEDGSSFNSAILLRAFNSRNNDDFRFQVITIVPRYTIWFNDIYFRLIDRGDPSYEGTSEWKIQLYSHGYKGDMQYSGSEVLGEANRWSFDQSESILPTPWRVLEGSHRSYDIFKAGNMSGNLTLTELDPISDDVYSNYFELGITSANGWQQVTVDILQLRYYQEVKLVNVIQNHSLPTLEE